MGGAEATGFGGLTCGAGCRSWHGRRALDREEDVVRWGRIGRRERVEQLQPGHFGEMAFATTPEGACVNLGTAASDNACRIDEDRGTTCREFEKGSWQCLEFRRDRGVE